MRIAHYAFCTLLRFGLRLILKCWAIEIAIVITLMLGGRHPGADTFLWLAVVANYATGALFHAITRSISARVQP